MNIIVISRRLSSSRNFDLARRRVWLPLAGAAFGVGLLFALGGLAAGVWLGQLPQQQTIERLQTRAAHNQAALDRLRAASRAHLTGLAQRLGELQAEAMRLNALGRRLVDMAGIEQGEFDFDRVPPVGGPKQPANTAVPQLPAFDQALSRMAERLERQRRQLSVLAELLRGRELKQRHVPSGWPVESGWISSDFGRRIDPFTGEVSWHWGLDFAGHKGTKVHAVADGVVVWTGKRYGYGKLVGIDHGNGYVTRYAHNSKILVEEGEWVEKGEVISLMGATGRATAPNLHFEVLKNGEKVNPYAFVSRSAD